MFNYNKKIPPTAPITISELAEYVYHGECSLVQKKRIYRILRKLHEKKPILFRLGRRKNSNYYTSLSAIKEAGFNFDHSYFEENLRLEEEIEHLRSEVKRLEKEVELLSFPK